MTAATPKALAFVALASLLLLAPGPVPAPASDFEFVVIGDTRPTFESENFRVFEALVPKINALRPAFTINLGDLIYGYGVLSKDKQWNAYERAARKIAGPYYQVPGNHDTYSAAARQAYGRRFGKFYESFDRGDCHFVLIDNGEDGEWGRIGPAQMAWLERDLAATKAAQVFVFLHFPTWEQDRVIPKYHVFWRDTLHPLFRRSNVKAVFGGHFHCYGPTREFDGIRYFITGGGGAELKPDYQSSGGEHHFMKVHVSGGRFEVRVVTNRGVLQDVDADLMGGFLFAERNTSRIGIVEGTADLKQGVGFRIQIDNPYTELLAGTAVWHFDRTQFEVTPANRAVRVPAESSVRLPFTVKALGDRPALDALPWVEFALSAGDQRHRFHRVLLFMQSLTAARRQGAPAIDGGLDDWKGAAALKTGSGVSTALVRASHDTRNLYLAIDVPVSPDPLSDDSVFSDELQIGFARRAGETDFGGETLRIGFEASDGPLRVGDRTPGHVFGAPLPTVRAAVSRSGAIRTFELAIPYALLGRVAADPLTRLVMSLSYPLPDGVGPREEGEPSPNSLAYQVRYGGDVLVPVHFIELVLDTRK